MVGAGVMKCCVPTPPVLRDIGGSDAWVLQQASNLIFSSFGRIEHERGCSVKIWEGGVGPSVQQEIEDVERLSATENGVPATYLCNHVGAFYVHQPHD